ncbi:MAG: DMT family transporter [Pirellula sp.]
MHEDRRVGLADGALLLVLGAIWGASFLFMRLAAPAFGPIGLIAVRVSIAGVFLVLLAMVQGVGRDLWRYPWRMLVVGMTNSAIPYCLFAYATLDMTAGFASILNATAPFFGALIAAWVLKDRLSFQKWMGLAVGFLGVCILVTSQRAVEGGWKGVTACLVAACLYAIAAHYSKRQLRDVAPMAIAASSQVASTLVLLPLAILYWPPVSPGWNPWLAATMLGLLCTGGALAIYFKLLQSMGAMPSMAVAYLIPLFGVLWGVLFLGESLQWSLLFGGSLILLGLYSITTAK